MRVFIATYTHFVCCTKISSDLSSLVRDMTSGLTPTDRVFDAYELGA